MKGCWGFILLAVLLLAPLSSLSASELQVEEYGQIPLRSVEGDGIYMNDLQLIIDGKFAEEGGAWNQDRCVYWQDPDTTFVLDLGVMCQVIDVLLQVDDDDLYTVEFSEDGMNYAPFYSFYAGYGQTGEGLDTMSTNPGDPHHVLLPERDPVQARYLRISASSGDQEYSLAEFQVFGYLLETAETAEAFLITPAAVQGTGDFSGSPDLLIDDLMLAEASAWDESGNVSWSDPSCQFVIDLGRPYRVLYVLVQVNSGNLYRIDYSLDDLTYISLFSLASEHRDVDAGMDTVCTDPSDPEYVPDLDFFPVEARYIRIYGVEGQGSFAVSELQVFGQELPPAAGR